MPEKIGIVVDSTADFPEGMVNELNITLIPIHIVVDGEDYLHGVTISNEDVIRYLAEGREVKTAPPFPSEYSDCYERMAEQYDHVLSFHVSADLSNCYQSAVSSVKILFDDVAEKITLIDTRSVSVGQALLVKKAAKIRKRYSSPAELLDHLKAYMKESLLLFTVENLFWLKRAGKLNIFSSLVGSFLNVKPIIALADGKLVPVAKHKGRQQAIDAMIVMARKEHNKYGMRQDIWIAHAQAESEAREIQTALGTVSADMKSEVRLVEVGPTIAVHTGPGSLCLSMMRF